ncbi:recombinase family protein [Brevibacillus sp. NPDC058079]|uniref:recombinase family protein n=1 Tax=Brevibacillus sp. NPDC058079 TaxID=3346330 RepID=UPI0036EC23A5
MPLVQNEAHKVYMKLDVKAIDPDRSDLIQLIADLEKGVVSKIICLSAERISRNPVELGDFIRLANRMNIPVIFAE